MTLEQNIEKILNQSKNIAILGLSPDESKASHRVAKYLKEQGFKIYPIYPKCDEILGEKVYRKLEEIKDKIDTLVMFRKSEVALQILPSLVKKQVSNLWLQLGISNDEAKQKCENLGISFVQDRCIMIELQRKNHART